jgi:hypothetical protein
MFAGPDDGRTIELHFETTKAKAPKATKGGPQIKKDGKGRFWIVPKDGSAEQGPFETKQAALAAKAGDPAPKVSNGDRRRTLFVASRVATPFATTRKNQTPGRLSPRRFA